MQFLQHFFKIEGWQAQVKNALLRWIIIGTVFSTLFSLTGYLGGFHRYLELTSHFKLQYLVVGCIAFIFFSVTRRKWLSLVSLFCVALNLAVIVPWYIPQPTDATVSAGTPLKVLLANVLTSNRQYSKIISLVEKNSPDIAVFLEVNEVWSKQLEAIQDILPYSLVYPREDNFGIALYSKTALNDPAYKFFADEDVVSLLANVSISDQIVSIVSTHPLPPSNQEYFNGRNTQLEEISKYVQQLKNPHLVVGDLNATMWSPYYKQFIQKSGLHNTRAGFGILPTWPAQSPLLYIPLDHCLVSSKIKVRETKTLENIGSDHLPLICDLALPRKT
ncbi:endonuclease/exonuclease/phosphatase family protein [Microcoleus sp. FACHB-68]|uniref:endonuclease/exonuclease/phosphatase family protein n=1 Tax=Microcoleus sp. FACHB-68 TaxID=2692826 RepID=UPI0016830F24|nr:endonuclease/exonuclease/phosphatase family protein [Microcoleus sp. FACHB-68]MBD1940060.1 endonuclease/exonuclease/phosphatase family protein [Microcoleus sp. FACHB-68]